jgi:hypothetical protein
MTRHNITRIYAERGFVVIGVALRLIAIFSVTTRITSAFTSQQKYHRSTQLSAEMCPEIPLFPRPGNEMAIVALG